MRDLTKDVYVSSVEGHIVARHGSGTVQTKPMSIGVYREVKEKADGSTEFVGMRWDTEEVVLLPAREFAFFAKEYEEELRVGTLKERTKAEYEAWSAKREKESEALRKRLEAEAKLSDDEKQRDADEKSLADAEEAAKSAAAEAEAAKKKAADLKKKLADDAKKRAAEAKTPEGS
jgi:colicin import membrane protein